MSTIWQGFDRRSDWEQGRDDGYNLRPRESTRAHYRAGYDKGLSDRIKEKRT